MTPVFVIGTLIMLGLLYWAAYRGGKEINTVEFKGNLLLSVPEAVFKLVLLGLCMGLISSLQVEKPLNYVGWLVTDPLFDIVVGVAIGLVIRIVVNFLTLQAVRIFGPSIYSPKILQAIVPRNLAEWFLIPLPLLLAVVVEEVLFRGLAVGGMSAFLGLNDPSRVYIMWLLAVISSVIFGLAHAPQGLLGIIFTGLVGFAFAAIFIVSNSLVMVIAAHYVINLLQIVRAKQDQSWIDRYTKARPAPATAPALAKAAEDDENEATRPEESAVTAPVDPTSAKI